MQGIAPIAETQVRSQRLSQVAYGILPQIQLTTQLNGWHHVADCQIFYHGRCYAPDSKVKPSSDRALALVTNQLGANLGKREQHQDGFSRVYQQRISSDYQPIKPLRQP